jgi:O-antigen ligase
MSNTRLARATPYLAVVATAVLAGAVVATIQWQLALLVAIAGVAVLGLALLRALVTPSDTTARPVDDAHLEDPRLRPARLAYYLGAATIGFLEVRPALGFTASDWIFLAALGLAALVIVVHGLTPPYLIPRAVTVGVLVFALGGIISSLEAVYPYQSAFIVVRMLYLTLIWFWLGTIVLQTRAHVQTALAAWVCSAALSSSGAVIQFFYGDVIPGGTVAFGRMTGFTGHFNILGGLAATAFVPALMLAVDSPRRGLRLVGTVAVALIGVGLLLSGSVGGLLAASVGTMVWLALRGVSMRILVSGAVALAAALVLMSATGSTDSPSPIDRIKRVTSAEQAGAGTGGTIYTRLEVYGEAWSRIVEQPFVGIGLDPGTSAEFLGEENTVHNVLLGPWFTAGILGLVGIVMLVGGAIATGLRVLRNSTAQERAVTAALVASLATFVQHAMGEPILFVRYGWFPTALLIALNAQQIRLRSRAYEEADLPRQAVGLSLGRAR